MSTDVNESGLVKEKLNCETAKVSWKELKVHFERGAVLRVNKHLDLVEVAVKIAQDDTQGIETLLTNQQLVRLDKENTQGLGKDDAYWAVVVAPWVIIQSEHDREASLSTHED